MTAQDQMIAKLKETGLPHKEIHCYGSQIVVTCWCRDSAFIFADMVKHFAKIKMIKESRDYDKVNSNTSLKPSSHKVWRVWATI